MSDTVGKIFKQAFAELLRKYFREKCTLSADQYKFRTSCSAIDATWKLKTFLASAIKKRQLGAAISLDIIMHCSDGNIVYKYRYVSIFLDIESIDTKKIGKYQDQTDNF